MLEMLKNMNIPADKLEEIMANAKDNPMAAMAAIQEYLSPEMIQQLMMMFMQNPDAFSEMAESAGVSSDQIDQIKGQFSN